MAADPQKQLFLMNFLFFMILSVSTQGPMKFVYNGFSGSKLHLDGIANIHPNGLLQLTNSSETKKAHVFWPIPLRLSASPWLSTTFVFAMYPHQPSGGHGMAFILSPSMDFSHALATEFLGLFNYTNNGFSSNHVFAVELDTTESPLFGDIDDNHVGIDVNDLRSVEAASVMYYSDQERRNLSLNLTSGKPMQVWIEYEAYEAKKSIVEVVITPLGFPKPKQNL